MGWYCSSTCCTAVLACSEGRWEPEHSVGSVQWLAFGENNQMYVFSVVLLVWFGFLCLWVGFFLLFCFFKMNFKLDNVLNKYTLSRNDFWSSVWVWFPRKPKYMFLSLHCHSYANLIQTWKRRRYWRHWILEYFIKVCSWEERRELNDCPLKGKGLMQAQLEIGIDLGNAFS